ncbi:MAG: cobyrinic acid ac-diamide synthase [Solirubrobacterales bacterium]|nr:cobyrinic acid ac-diamide synthase [Solirubrobacterales bacterium]
MRLAVAGKGGSGKSVVTGTLARILARRGHKVLALDSDTLEGLAFSLGATVPDSPPLLAAAARGEDDRWRFVPGIGPVRAVQRFSTSAPDGIRLLQIGKTTTGGQAPVMAATQAFHKTIHGLDRARTFDDWVLLGDLSAGPRQAAYDWAPYARRILLVVEPTRQSMMTARRIRTIAAQTRPGTAFSLVVNKATHDEDPGMIAAFLDLKPLGVVPVDEAVRASERAGIALIDHAPDAPALGAIERLADALERSTVEP